jgi:hypothetical protein
MKQTIDLRLGDCIEVLAGFSSGSIGAIVSDPPYFLSFMGRDWDTVGRKIPYQQRVDDPQSLREDRDFPPGYSRGGLSKDVTKHRHNAALEMQKTHEAWLKEAFRVLKPGGIIKAFSGTRTKHRLERAVVEAGFEIVRQEIWTYGCLSEDTEILTESGWRLGVDVSKGEEVACWNPDSEEITLSPVQEVFKAPFTGSLVSFKNDNTDQLLTPNHRVYKKHRIRKMVEGVRVSSEEESWSVQEAGEINRWNNIRLPLTGLHNGKGIGGVKRAALLGWVWTEGGFDNPPSTGVRIYQSSVNQDHVDEIQDLLNELVPYHKKYEREREYKGRKYVETCWFFTGEMAQWARSMLPDKHPDWALLWGMTLEEKHSLLDAALKGDGSNSGGRWAFYQKSKEDLIWFQTLCHVMGWQARLNFKKIVAGIHKNPVTQLQGRHLKASVSEDYDGEVWCVRVPTGAFLARRKGKIFVTGNSGFPKSLNIGKKLDQIAGAEREVVGKYELPDVADGLRRKGWDCANKTPPCMFGSSGQVDITAPISDAAKQWEGWGTALKPAHEPVVVGRKPE